MHGAGRGRCWLMKHAIFRSSDAPSVEGEGRQGCLHFVPGALAYHHFSKGAAVFPLLGTFFPLPPPLPPRSPQLWRDDEGADRPFERFAEVFRRAVARMVRIMLCLAIAQAAPAFAMVFASHIPLPTTMAASRVPLHPRRVAFQVQATVWSSRPSANGAALAAASWGSWRVRDTSGFKARARHVLVSSEDEALSLMKQLAFGADIGQLAAQHSLCPSKDKGGDLGAFGPGDMAEEFESFVFDEKSPVGVPLGPVKTPFGYHLIVIDERSLHSGSEEVSEVGSTEASDAPTTFMAARAAAAPEHGANLATASSATASQTQQDPANGAALAAASWGSWRVRDTSGFKARARHVLVSSEDEALSLMKQLAFGADIGQLAAQHSLCPSKDKGGDLGAFGPGDMAEEFESFVFDEKSPVGVPLGPVKTPFGYHLIVIDERTL